MKDLSYWRETIESLPSPCPAEAVTDIAGAMRLAATAPGHAALEAHCTEERAELGRDLLLALDTSAIEACVERAFPADPNQRAWLMQRLVQAELDLRARVLAKVEALLDDRAWLADPPSSVALEVRPPSRRVCDQAYVSLRQLVHPEEDQVGYQVESEAFLHMPADAKDRVIEKARNSRTWNMKAPSPGEVGY